MRANAHGQKPVYNKFKNLFCNKIPNRKPQCLTQYMDIAYRRLFGQWCMGAEIAITSNFSDMEGVRSVRTASTSWSKKCGTIFRNVTCASLDQKVAGLGTRKAWARWPPKTLLGYYAQNLCRLKGLPSWQLVAMDADFWNIRWFLYTELGLRLFFCTPVTQCRWSRWRTSHRRGFAT